MKKIIILWILMLAISSYGQNIGLEFFHEGSKLIELGNYNGADSLLTRALCRYRHQNVYFNRALARLYMNDTIGSCIDLNYAANKYFDSEAASLFNTYCCNSIDTIFYDKKLIPTINDKYRYFEIIQELKYDSIVIGKFHDLKAEVSEFTTDWGCDNNTLIMNRVKTNLIAVYIINDSIKYYYRSTNNLTIKHPIKYEDLKKRSKMLFESKYGYLKTNNNLNNLSVYFQITVNKNGDIEEVKYVGLFPDIEIGEIENEIEKDLLVIVNNYPKVTPARFKGEKVNFITYDFIDY